MATTAFVTGGSGFVGRNLITALRTHGDIVRALARSQSAAEQVGRNRHQRSTVYTQE
jgi:nucleoside-diphosphate-sugar epimerase